MFFLYVGWVSPLLFPWKLYKNCTNHDLLQFSTAFGRYCYNLGLLVNLCVESFCCKLSCCFNFYFTLYLISSNLTGVLVQFDWCIGAFAGLLWGTVFHCLCCVLGLGCHFSVGGGYTVLGCHSTVGGSHFGCWFTFKIIPPFLVPFLQNRRNRRNRRANKRT